MIVTLNFCVLLFSLCSNLPASMTATSSASSRLDEVVAWLGHAGDDGALIIFDESHSAKNLTPGTDKGMTKTAKCVKDLQDRLPRAKVLYSSATGASEPRNLAYMTRLWGTENTINMANTLSKGGLGVMELAAMSLKATGSYLARTLSYKGADFDLANVKVPDDLRLMYDRSVMFWKLIYNVLGWVGVGNWRNQYRAAHQRFYRSMLMATKVPECAQIAQKAVEQGQSVIIGLQSTGEAAAEQVVKKAAGALDDLVSTPTQILDSFLRSNFPVAGTQVDQWERTGSLETLEYYIMAAKKAWGRLPRAQEVITKYNSSVPPSSAQGESSSTSGRPGLIRDEIEREEFNLMTGYHILYNSSVNVGLNAGQRQELERAREEVKAEPGTSGARPSAGAPATAQRTFNSTNPNNSNLKFTTDVDIDLTGDSSDEEDTGMPQAPVVVPVPRSTAALPPSTRNSAGTVTPPSGSVYIKAEPGTAMGVKPAGTGCEASAEPMEIDNLQDPIAAYPAGVGNINNTDNGIGATDLSTLGSAANSDFSLRLLNMRGWLLEIVKNDLELPLNPLDDLIQRLGGQSKVAELTGRKGFVGPDEDGIVRYIQRSIGEGPVSEINLREKDKFMNGTKRFAIISDAASTGISLHADRRATESKDFRRCHLTLELPWSADKAVQQFGRSHRANQESAPHYRILVTPCGGEYRFASAAAKRLQSLGALLRGDRNAVGAGSELKAFDVDTPAGIQALRNLIRCFTDGTLLPGVKVPELPEEFGYPATSSPVDSNPNDPGNILNAPFFRHFQPKMRELGLSIETENTAEKSPLKMSLFLNRLLGLRMVEQDLLFKFFADTLDETISKQKSKGIYDVGIVSLIGRSISVVDVQNVHTDPSCGARVDRVTLDVDGGLSFDEAQAQLEEAKQRVSAFITEGRAHLSGFYRLANSKKLIGTKMNVIVLATEVLDAAFASSRIGNVNLRLQYPYSQETPTFMKMNKLTKGDWKGDMIDDNMEAKELWDAWFDFTAKSCEHGDECR